MVVELSEAAWDTERQLRAKKVPEAAILETLKRSHPECFADEQTGISGTINKYPESEPGPNVSGEIFTPPA